MSSSSVGDDLDAEIAATELELKRMGISIPDVHTHTNCHGKQASIGHEFKNLVYVTAPYRIPTKATGAPPEIHPSNHLSQINKTIVMEHATSDLGLSTDQLEQYMYTIQQNENGYQSLYNQVMDEENPARVNDLYVLADYTIFMIHLISLIGIHASPENQTSLNHSSELYFKQFTGACDSCVASESS